MALLHDGHLLALDAPQRLQDTLAGHLLEVVADAPRPPVDLLRKVPGVEDVQNFGDRAHARIHPGSQAALTGEIERALAAAGIGGIGVRPIVASLEDVFIDLITGNRR